MNLDALIWGTGFYTITGLIILVIACGAFSIKRPWLQILACWGWPITAAALVIALPWLLMREKK